MLRTTKVSYSLPANSQTPVILNCQLSLNPVVCYCFTGLLLPSLPSELLCNVASRLSSRLDISSTIGRMLASTPNIVPASIQRLLFAKISLDTPANLLDREFNSSSTTAESSAEAEVSVVVCGVMLVGLGFQKGVRSVQNSWIGDYCWENLGVE